MADKQQLKEEKKAATITNDVYVNGTCDATGCRTIVNFQQQKIGTATNVSEEEGCRKGNVTIVGMGRKLPSNIKLLGRPKGGLVPLGTQEGDFCRKSANGPGNRMFAKIRKNSDGSFTFLGITCRAKKFDEL